MSHTCAICSLHDGQFVLLVTICMSVNNDQFALQDMPSEAARKSESQLAQGEQHAQAAALTAAAIAAQAATMAKAQMHAAAAAAAANLAVTHAHDLDAAERSTGEALSALVAAQAAHQKFSSTMQPGASPMCEESDVVLAIREKTLACEERLRHCESRMLYQEALLDSARDMCEQKAQAVDLVQEQGQLSCQQLQLKATEAQSASEARQVRSALPTLVSYSCSCHMPAVLARL
jgi:hypothetical protein